MFDLISAIELAASAMVVIIGFVTIFGGDAQGRLWIALCMSGWFVLIVVAGATKTLYYDGGFGVPGLGLAVLIPILLLSALFFGIPYGRERLRAAHLPAMIGLQAVRVLGVSFVILYAVKRLPAPFAPIAGWGDIAVGAAALPVAWLVHRVAPGSGRAALVWNIAGLLDLVVAVGLGATSSPGPIRLFGGEPSSAIMTLLPWVIIPCFLVPALSFVHIVTFYRLALDRRLATGNGAPLEASSSSQVAKASSQ